MPDQYMRQNLKFKLSLHTEIIQWNTVVHGTYICAILKVKFQKVLANYHSDYTIMSKYLFIPSLLMKDSGIILRLWNQTSRNQIMVKWKALSYKPYAASETSAVRQMTSLYNYESEQMYSLLSNLLHWGTWKTCERTEVCTRKALASTRLTTDQNIRYLVKNISKVTYPGRMLAKYENNDVCSTNSEILRIKAL